MANGLIQPEVLPQDGSLTIGTAEIPRGRRIKAGVSGEPQPDGETEVMWMTDSQLDEPGRTWWNLRSNSPLIPVLLDALDGPQEVEEPRRPWDSELVIWDTEVLGTETVAESLEKLWSENDEDPFVREQMLPFTEFPGLATAETDSLPSAEIERAVKSAPKAWLGLVPAKRPADVPLHIGWFATSDAFVLGPWTPSTFTAVLRSWEDRFGASVFRLGFAEMRLLVTRPPRSIEAALTIASEFFDVASEFHCEDGGATNSVQKMAECIVGSPWWTFWWD